jgi:phosphonate transport system ATP-binding protein
MAAAITLHKVSTGYNGALVLHDITLSIEPGERVAIMGRSGAGKSTLLNTIYRHYPDCVALIPQPSALVANLSVFHNVFMGCLDRHSTLYNLRTHQLNLARIQADLPVRTGRPQTHSNRSYDR